MEGLERLISLPDVTKGAIGSLFGSVGELYRKVFDLYNEDYTLHLAQAALYQIRQKEILRELHSIQLQLTNAGLEGQSITKSISSDFLDVIFYRNTQQLDSYFLQLGTDNEDMRNWLQEKYGICIGEEELVLS